MPEKKQYRGLTDAEVAESRRIHGDNLLTPPVKEPLWKQFLHKFRDPLIIILLIAGVLSVGISCYEYWVLKEGATVFFEPTGIFVAILLATGMAFLFEMKADREFAVLNRVNDDEPVQVMRNGRVTQVGKKDIVVGDIVFLNTGDEVPADGKLLEAISLNIDESTLTGEPICHKTTDPAQQDPDATFPSDQAMRGTKVMEGHGVMQVTAVGDATENGKVFTAAQIDDGVKTPLSEQLDRLGKLIAKLSYVIGAAVVAGRVTMYFVNVDAFDWVGFMAYFLQTVMIAVTLIVVAVPEGLPMAVTLSLAYSMRRMLKTNNQVRRLHACETMGATTVICTDKTGTLTQNRMQVARADFFGHPSTEIIYEGIAVNSTAQLDLSGDKPEVLGNPTEGALLLWLQQQGVDYADIRRKAEVTEELPFSTERKYMATVVRSSCGGTVLYVKGAPEIVFGMCGDTSGVTKEEVDAQLLVYQSQAMRTLGFAYRKLEEGESCIADGKLKRHDLTFLGIAAISDPVRPDVPDAVAEVTGAGIKIKIVTGDTPGTAKEIGRQIGLWNDATDGDRNIITGTDFAALTDKELAERVAEIKIIARARPMDKKRLVEALQRAGEVVAGTGDGTNDAPALAQADVAVAMNSGTQAAKEAGNMVDLDSSPTKLIDIVRIGKQLLMTRGSLTTFSIANDVAKYFAIIPALFMGLYPGLSALNIMGLHSPQSAVLSAIIYNALIIIALIPLALKGVKYREVAAGKLLSRNLLVYGLGGLAAPFIFVKLIDVLLVFTGLV